MDTWRTLSADGNIVTLKRFNDLDLKPLTADEVVGTELQTGCALDVETTGVDRSTDSVIEIGLQVFYFHPKTGEIVGKGESISQFQDPGRPLSGFITQLTGIQTSDVQGQNIDWVAVSKHLTSAQLIVAHNAGFDRGFIDRYAQYPAVPVWACSLKHVGWMNHGFTSASLPMLAAYHGFFSNAHRALVDAQMVVHLLAQNRSYVTELYENAHRPRVFVKLSNTPYESRMILRENGYRWNPPTKTWSKSIAKEELTESLERLPDIYQGYEPQYEAREISPTENFKS
ncbi:hypothetical protein K2X30_13780 [bacterium]|nr:hypothetical protein [bacterium]